MRKTILSVTLCAALISPLLTGCSHDKASDFDNMSRADQQKAMQPDPVKMKEMADKYAHQGPPPGTPAPGTPATKR